MNPIPTTKAMNPAPAKGIQSFPTPVIQDIVISEIVNAWKGDYQKLEYGTKWDDVPHASQQGSFPDHKLIFQQPASEDGQWVKRIWANDRIDQDSYNYAIKYSGGSDQHPIYIRTYIEPRATYAPVPDLTPDSVYPTALLVEEEVQRTEGELDSEYVKVVRVFETLPGPSVTSQRYNERGDLETINVQTVSPSTAPDPDGLLVTQTQVLKEDVSKGTKTTATVPSHSTLLIKEKKEGLLGETVTTDNIVDPATNPDALSQSVVASVVQQTSATKAVKRTTTAIGPTSLTQQSKDGKLLGDVTATETIVDPSTAPDSVSSLVLSSEVRQIDSGKAVKKNTILNSTPTLSGNQNEQGLLGTKETTESIVPAGTSADALSLSVISSQVEPIDSVRSKKTTVISAGPTSLSGGQKKEGLLGEINVEEFIVAAGSFPDELSETIVSSVVEPIDSAKSKKTTITSTGPTSLAKKSNDGKLLGDVTSTQSVVAPDSDPDSPSETILSSEVNQVDSGKAIKTNIAINSTPTLSGNQNEQGLLGNKTTEERIVPAGTSADVLSLSVISSTVEPIDSVRSRIVTVESSGPMTLSGGQKKEGLLGETDVVESIVEAGSLPDALSQTVVSSTIEPIDSAKSKKTTITAIGPTSLAQKSKDGKLLGDITITESIVAPNAIPDSPSGTTSGILSSEIKQVDSGKAVKRNAVLNSSPVLAGSQKQGGLLGKVTTTEQIVAAGTAADDPTLTIVSSSVEPIDTQRSRKVTQTSIGPTVLTGRAKKDGLLGETTITESIVTAGASPDNLSISVISSEVTPIDSAKSKKTTIESTSPTSLQTTSLVDSPVGKVAALLQESIVAPNQSPSGGKLVLQDEIKSIDSAKAKRDRITVSSYPALTTYDLDESLGVVIITQRSVVDHNAPYSPPALVLTSSDRPLDQWKTLRITSRLSQLPPERTEYKTQQFVFPALLSGVTVVNLNLGFGRIPINSEESEYATNINKFISITPQLRPALSLPTRIRITTTFYTSQPQPDPVYQITTQNVSYSGSLFSLNFGDVILNPLNIGPIVASENDPRFSGLSEGISFPASIPDYNQYSNLIGEEIIIFSDVEYYKSNIWFKRNGYVVLV